MATLKRQNMIYGDYNNDECNGDYVRDYCVDDDDALEDKCNESDDE